jgi:radical SAM protein with 4Fe4S-binding SPASM domain
MKLTNYLNTISYAKHLFLKDCASPIYLIFFVTERCNAKCKHCFVNVPNNKRIKEELTLQESQKISNNMGRLLYLLPTGGEPFLREDLPDIINIFYKNNQLRNVGIPTNGSLTERVVASVNRTLSLCGDLRLGVDISIDALHDAHDQIRGFPGLFEKAIATYWRLKELERQNHRFRVCVEVTVSSFNQESLSEIYSYFLNTLRVDNLFVRLVRGNPRDPSAKEVDIEKFASFAKKLEEDLRDGVFYGHSAYPLSEFITARDMIGRRLTIKIVEKGEFQIPCYAGKLTGVIRTNGDVYPCELLNEHIGNLRQHNYDLRELWQSERAERIRKQIRQTRCFCTHECFITNNILFNLRMLPKVLKEYVDLKLR